MVSNAGSTRWWTPRPAEMKLLGTATLLITGFWTANYYSLAAQSASSATCWLNGLVLIAAIWLAHGLLVTFGSRADETVLPVVSTLLGFGVAFQLRLNGDLPALNDPLAFIPAGAVTLSAATALVITHRRIHWIRRMEWLLYAVCLVIPLAVMVTGVTYRGGRYGPNLTTPAEFVKPFIILATAVMLLRFSGDLGRKRRLFSQRSRRAHTVIIASFVLVIALFLFMRDLGMIAILSGIWVIMLWTLTARWVYPLTAMGVLMSAAVVFQFFQKGQARFEAWLNPFLHPEREGYQIVQSLFALFNGEVLGQGPGNGLPGSIPLVNTDFVFAAIAEEYGLVGCILLLAGFCHLAQRCVLHAYRSRDPLASLICSGIAALLMIQLLLNIGGVIKLVPLTGVALPFISRGGSCTLAVAFLAGIVLGISSDALPRTGKTAAPRPVIRRAAGSKRG